MTLVRVARFITVALIAWGAFAFRQQDPDPLQEPAGLPSWPSTASARCACRKALT